MTLLTDSAEAAAFCRRLADEDFVTIDTEFMRERTFWPKLCLVQLAGADESHAIDPLADGMDLGPLYTLLADTGVLKVMHGARQDIEIFVHQDGRVPAPLFDTQIAAMVCGFGDQVGYETLIARLTGHRLDKSSRFTDWSARPLTERQITYALGDVTHLRTAYAALRDQIEENGRMGWLGEELASLTDPGPYVPDPETAWQRLKPRSRDPQFLSVLRAAAAWRERESMERDIPRNRELRDEALSEIAAHPPRDAAALERVRGVGRGFGASRAGGDLLAAVQVALALPRDAAPAPLQHDTARGPQPVVDLLKVLLKYKCEHHHVAQKLVASSDDLHRIAENDEADVAALRGWRRELFGADALRIKHGELALGAHGLAVALMPVTGEAADRSELQTAAPAPNPRRRRKRRRRRSNGGDAAGATDAKQA